MDAGDFDFVRVLVRDRSAIVLETGKEYMVEARLESLVSRRGFNSLQTLITAARKESAGPLRREVVEAMTTNETLFFRDMHVFEALRKNILPGLIERRKAERVLRIWCAACSSGQEPFSLAILLKEHFAQLASWKIQILATDLSSEMVERARSGTYRQLEVNRGLPSALLLRHFEKRGLEWHVRAELKSNIEFQQMNLVEAWPHRPPFDLVFLRNVLYYFEPSTRRTLLGQMLGALRTDGVLLLGATETVVGVHPGFVPVAYPGATAFERRSCL